MQNFTIYKEGSYSEADLDLLIEEYKPLVKDVLKIQLSELFEVSNPSIISDVTYTKQCEDFISKNTDRTKGNWVYYPWSNMFLHTLNNEDLYQLRTNRNQNLITSEEQQILKDYHVGIVGLSVGSNIASNLVYQGIGKTISLADFDTLSPTNLNRVRARVDQVGQKKIDIVEQHLKEIDPYIEVCRFDNGLNTKNLESFFKQPHQLKLVFEIIDDFKMKIEIRKMAKSLQIPLVMMTNLGDTVLIDVERYDLDEKLPLFNGLLPNISEIEETQNISIEDEKKYSAQIVGYENIPKRALDSLSELGKTLAGRPQLMQTCSISAGLATHIAREIALGRKVESGRKLFKVSDII